MGEPRHYRQLVGSRFLSDRAERQGLRTAGGARAGRGVHPARSARAPRRAHRRAPLPRVAEGELRDRLDSVRRRRIHGLVTKPACLLAPALWLIASAGLAQTNTPFPRIRSIVIEHTSVFGPEERLDNIPHVPDLTFIFHLANFLHIDTKEEVIRRELLVHEGGPADPALIAESERNLRALPYIRRVKILVSPAPEGQVDLDVIAQDTWTTQPRVSFAVGGGSQRSSFGVVEDNVLGYGKKVRLLYRHGIDRNSTL